MTSFAYLLSLGKQPALIQIAKADELWSRPFNSLTKKEKEDAPIRRVKGNEFNWEARTRLGSTHAWLNLWIDFKAPEDKLYLAYVNFVPN